MPCCRAIADMLVHDRQGILASRLISTRYIPAISLQWQLVYNQVQLNEVCSLEQAHLGLALAMPHGQSLLWLSFVRAAYPPAICLRSNSAIESSPLVLSSVIIDRAVQPSSRTITEERTITK